MDTAAKIFLGAVGLAIALVVRRYVGYSDRERIKANLASYGAVVISMDYDRYRSTFGPMSRARVYNVRYSSRDGRIFHGTCATTSFKGVKWIDEVPPGLYDRATAATPNASLEGRDHSNPSAAGEMICLDCGASIPCSKARCPHCGWSRN